MLHPEAQPCISRNDSDIERIPTMFPRKAHTWPHKAAEYFPHIQLVHANMLPRIRDHQD